MKLLRFAILAGLLSAAAFVSRAEAQLGVCWRVSFYNVPYCGTVTGCCGSPCGTPLASTCQVLCCTRCFRPDVCRGPAPF